MKGVARYDSFDPNDQYKLFTPWRRTRMTVGLEVGIQKNTRLRYEYQYNDIDGTPPLPYLQSGGEDTITMHMASIIFSF